jgi:hypothetical protein
MAPEATMKVHYDSVECRSAFDMAHGAAIVVRVAGARHDAGADIRLVELEDVLFLPSILEPGQSICLAEERFVPMEAVLDCGSVEFFKTSRRRASEFQGKYADNFDADRFEGRVCILGNLFSRNFGHWTEELLKVAILEQSAQDCRYVLPTLPSFARDSLAFLGVDDSRIVTINTPTVFARVLFTTAVSHENLAAHPEALTALRNMVQLRLGSSPSSYGPRLWLERGEGVRNGGITTNRDEVFHCIERYGFEVVDMATLPVADQLRAARHATTIGGPHGSQFVLAQFMPTASTVIECFSPMYVNPSILQICRVLKHSYHQVVARCNIVAPYLRGRDCEVDCEHLALVLDSCLR